jgi:hypothetical protein
LISASMAASSGTSTRTLILPARRRARCRRARVAPDGSSIDARAVDTRPYGRAEHGHALGNVPPYPRRAGPHGGGSDGQRRAIRGGASTTRHEARNEVATTFHRRRRMPAARCSIAGSSPRTVALRAR